ncbi:MAG: hypothetical protein ACMG55_02465 [Microcoleus sp.]
MVAITLRTIAKKFQLNLNLALCSRYDLQGFYQNVKLDSNLPVGDRCNQP